MKVTIEFSNLQNFCRSNRISKHYDSSKRYKICNMRRKAVDDKCKIENCLLLTDIKEKE